MERWLIEYIYWLFYNNGSIESLAKAAILKFEHMPDHIYKYRSFCENHLKALKQGVLYFTATDSLNDIKEANIVISPQADSETYQKIYNDFGEKYDLPKATITSCTELMCAVNDHFRRLTGENKEGLDYVKTEEFARSVKMLESIRKNQLDSQQKQARKMYSVCCFSAANDTNQMWAHYADNHQGFCIEYDFKSLGDEDLLTALLFPVLYLEDSRVFVNKLNQINGNSGLLAATIKEKTEWEREQEWRLVHHVKEHGTSEKMPKPTGIYLGERTNGYNSSIMLEHCVEKGIPLYKMKYNQLTDRIEPILLR